MLLASIVSASVSSWVRASIKISHKRLFGMRSLLSGAMPTLSSVWGFVLKQGTAWSKI
jgi:hypothetical protein